MGKGARQITSTDVDPPPQSVQFVRSSSAFSPKGRKLSIAGTTHTVTPTGFYSNQMRQHPSNKKFESLKNSMKIDISLSNSKVGTFFSEKIDRADETY